MDLKKEAALVASAMVKKNLAVGLGDGASVRWLAGYLLERMGKGLNLSLYTSSVQTQLFLEQSGIKPADISRADRLDIYFDGCDQLDFQLNALKSGAGIHTNEKIFAAMARRFILLADDSKFVPRMNSKFPLALETLPQATGFVLSELKKRFRGASLQIRVAEPAGKPIITRNGNLLIDCFFRSWPEPVKINSESKKIPGVVEISLFYKMANEAIVAGETGVRRFIRKQGRVFTVNPE